VAAKSKDDSKAKGKTKGKDKGSSAGLPGVDGASGLSLAGHPRAVRRVAQAKSWGGLAGFALCGYLSLPTHTPLDAAFRALVAGIVCYVVVWGAAVFLWRRLVVAELRHAEHELLTAHVAKLQSSDPVPPAAERRRAPVAS
jgi:hypothetical protein